jgi:LuxR family maltose regulon positive regulatory protein
MRDDAVRARELDRPDSPYCIIALTLEGVARRLLDDADGGRDALTEGARLGDVFLPSIATQCLARLALLETEADRWFEAERLVDRAMTLIDVHLLAERPAHAPVFAVAALVHARAGATALAKAEAKQAGVLVARLVGIGPWAAIEASIVTARAYLLFGDGDAAREHLSDARRMLDSYPDAGTLPAQLEAAELQAAAIDRPLGLTVAPLTDAELRVLRYLPTHLSFAEIAEELFVSRNTVKTQAIAVYRKLEVSSRGQAVERARALGLLAT